MPDATDSPPGPPQSSPLPGCLILSAILLVFGGLIVLYTFVGSYQNRELDTFTFEEPVELEVLSPSEEEREKTYDKFRAIGKAIEEGRSERFLVTSKDLNILIATNEDLADFRGQTFIERIADQGIVAHMVQPMRKGILRKGIRYLDATFVLQPEIRARTIAFQVMDIRPEKGSVPDGFIQNYRALDFFKLDPEWEIMKSSIESLAAVYGESGNLVIETKIPEPAVE